MKSKSVWALMVAVACGALCAGCAGNALRTNALGPAVAGQWPTVKEDADLGARARGTPVAAAALGVAAESGAVYQQRLGLHQEFDRAVRTLVAPK